MELFDSVTPESPWAASPTTTSVGSISSVPALPLSALRSTLMPLPMSMIPFALKSTRPALPVFALASNLAPPATVRFCAAFRRISPALPFALAMLRLAFLPISMFLPASTVMLLGVEVLLCAVRRPLTLALLTAPIWIEPLLTVIALALRRPLELTEAANFAA
ncbi:hypothetical protein ACVME8_008206 [Bradyrhizobium diazoefficiens]